MLYVVSLQPYVAQPFLRYWAYCTNSDGDHQPRMKWQPHTKEKVLRSLWKRKGRTIRHWIQNKDHQIFSKSMRWMKKWWIDKYKFIWQIGHLDLYYLDFKNTSVVSTYWSTILEVLREFSYCEKRKILHFLWAQFFPLELKPMYIFQNQPVNHNVSFSLSLHLQLIHGGDNTVQKYGNLHYYSYSLTVDMLYMLDLLYSDICLLIWGLQWQIVNYMDFSYFRKVLSNHIERLQGLDSWFTQLKMRKGTILVSNKRQMMAFQKRIAIYWYVLIFTLDTD